MWQTTNKENRLICDICPNDCIEYHGCLKYIKYIRNPKEWKREYQEYLEEEKEECFAKKNKKYN